jgi:metal-sulfur cluster biosynthetic enzyme
MTDTHIQTDQAPTETVRPSDLVRDDLPDLDAGMATALSSAPSMEDLTEAMKDVVDPELGINVVDLGLVYGLHLDNSNALTIDMTLTSAACPLTDVIEDQTNSALEGLVTSVTMNWVWMPPWGLEKITEDGRDQLRALGFNV